MDVEKEKLLQGKAEEIRSLNEAIKNKPKRPKKKPKTLWQYITSGQPLNRESKQINFLFPVNLFGLVILIYGLYGALVQEIYIGKYSGQTYVGIDAFLASGFCLFMAVSIFLFTGYGFKKVLSQKARTNLLKVTLVIGFVLLFNAKSSQL